MVQVVSERLYLDVCVCWYFGPSFYKAETVCNFGSHDFRLLIHSCPKGLYLEADCGVSQGT